MKYLSKRFIEASKILFIISVLIILSTFTVSAETYSDNVIPVMTSANTPSGEVSASSTHPNYTGYPWKAFNGNKVHYDNDYQGWIASDTSGWIQYHFSSAKTITKYVLYDCVMDVNQRSIAAPKDWTFEGSNDGINWTILHAVTNQTSCDSYTWNTNCNRSYCTTAFTFSNNTAYTYYRLNITSNNGFDLLYLNELEMMEAAITLPDAPANLTAIAGDSQVSLSWTASTGAESYNIKRATTSGGAYSTVASNIYTNSYTDTGLTNGTTYYYVVTAVNSAGESANSNEASATPQAPGGNKAILLITMTNGTEKEYDLSMSEVNAFISWYDSRAGGTGKAYYTINKSFNKGPFISRKDNIVFDKVLTFEVNEYSE